MLGAVYRIAAEFLWHLAISLNRDAQNTTGMSIIRSARYRKHGKWRATFISICNS